MPPGRPGTGGGVLRRSGRRVEGGGAVEHPDLDLAIAERRLDLDGARRVAVAVQHHVAGRLVHRLDQVLGGAARPTEARDGLAHERAHVGETVDVGLDGHRHAYMALVRHDHA
jgi:hypothetical protein